MARVQSTPLPPGLTFGVSRPSLMPDTIRPWIALLEQHGYEALWLGDHVEGPVPMVDIIVQLAQVAALSERLAIGCGVYLAPLRHPFLMARQVASLDLMSGGRLIFGVGVGGEFPNEYAACGVPLNQRGARLAEAMEVLKRLWSGEPTALAGRSTSSRRFGSSRRRRAPAARRSGAAGGPRPRSSGPAGSAMAGTPMW